MKTCNEQIREQLAHCIQAQVKLLIKPSFPILEGLTSELKGEDASPQ